MDKMKQVDRMKIDEPQFDYMLSGDGVRDFCQPLPLFPFGKWKGLGFGLRLHSLGIVLRPFDRFCHTPCLENEGTGLLALHFLGMTPGVPDFPTAHMHRMKIHKENIEKIMTQWSTTGQDKIKYDKMNVNRQKPTKDRNMKYNSIFHFLWAVPGPEN